MGVANHEEKANRVAVSRSMQGAGCWGKDAEDSEGGFSGRGDAGVIRGKVQTDSRRSVAGSKPGVLQGESVASRVRKNNSRIAQPSRIHRAEVGGRKPKGLREVKTIVIANQKGGVGKTATAVHLAFDFFEDKALRVALIDLDTQGNASYTLKDHDSGYKASQLFDMGSDSVRNCFSGLPEGPLVTLISSDPSLANMEKRSVNDAGKAFRDNVIALMEFVDVVLVDTPPSLGVSMAVALYAADFVLSPIEMEAYSIQGIKKMLTTIGNVRKINPKLQFLGMMPSRVDGRNPRHKRHLAELQAAYPKLMTSVKIGQRNSIADALASGVPVWKIKKTAARKAAQEVREVANFVFDNISVAESDSQLMRGVK